MLTIKTIHSAHTVYFCDLFGPQEKTANISVHSNNWLVFTTQTEWLQICKFESL